MYVDEDKNLNLYVDNKDVLIETKSLGLYIHVDGKGTLIKTCACMQ